MRGVLGAEYFAGRIGGHESFPPRYGWVKKGFDAVLKNPRIFTAPDAIIELGVGKNMVDAIRYWCQAFKVIEVGRKSVMLPTEFGLRLLSDDGWDPYLEDLATYWLLHWQLFTPPFYAAGWPLAFNRNIFSDFDADELGMAVQEAADAYPRLGSISANTYRREASCMIRMYTIGEERDVEALSPFTELGLVKKSENRVRFNLNRKHSLPPLIFVAACFSYAKHYLAASQRTISINTLTYGVNSPGVAFKLTETDVGRCLLDASRKCDGFSLVDVLGSTQVHFEGHADELYLRALSQYYPAVDSDVAWRGQQRLF